MSKHWNPGDELAQAGDARAKRWPAGATAGLMLVAAACVGIAALLYQVAGRRDVFTP